MNSSQNRQVIIGTPMSATDRDLSLITDICSEVTKANSLCKTQIQLLKQDTYGGAVYVQFAQTEMLQEETHQFIISDNGGLTRVIIPISECPIMDYSDDNCLVVAGISHLIEVRAGENDLERTTNGGIRVTTSVENLSTVLLDIALDISMSYALSGFKNLRSSESSLFEYSTAKAQFCHNKMTAYGPIPDDTTYASIASVSYDGNGFNNKKYIKNWKGFVASLSTKLNPLLSSLSFPHEMKATQTSVSPMILNIFSGHPQYRQLNLKKIEEMYYKLDPGQYILVRQYSAVKKEKPRRQLEPLLPGKPRIGKFTIIREADRDRYSNLGKYLTLYNFER